MEVPHFPSIQSGSAEASGSVQVHPSTFFLSQEVGMALPVSSTNTSQPSRAISRPVVDTLIQEKKLLERNIAAVNVVLVVYVNAIIAFLLIFQ
jgi:hypothetical protein